MRKISLLLAVVMVLSVFATCINAKPVPHVVPLETSEPEIDGKLDEGEWDDAAKIDVVADDLKYYLTDIGSQTNGYWTPEEGLEGGYELLHDSTLYAKTTEDGIYLAFDINDTSYGASYVKTSGSGAKYNANGGEGVSVTFKPNQDAVRKNSQGVVRISFSPFADQPFTSARTVNMIVYEDHAYNGDYTSSTTELTYIVDNACTADKNGYVIEAFIEWDVLETLGYEAPEYEAGNEILCNFAIHDAHNKRNWNPTPGSYWGVFELPINADYHLAYDNGASDGFIIADWSNPMTFIAYAANSGDTIAFGEKHCTLSFEVGSGDAVDPADVLLGETVDLSTYKSAKKGFSFVGWCTDEELENEVTSIEITDDTVLYAKFGELQQYTVTFDCNNGTTLAPTKVVDGDELDLAEFTTKKNSLTFVGWCTDEELTNLVSKITVTENTTLYAKFENNLTGSVFTKKATAPDTLDGEITEGEYDGAYVYSFNGNDMVYYGNNATRNWFATFDKTAIEARGSKMIGESNIYVLPTEDGVYFAFDVADETPGANYVRDIKWQSGVFHGDSVSVIFKKSNDAVTVADYAAGDAVRISVGPFKNDFTGSRAANIVSGITTDYSDSVWNITDTSFALNEGATGDSNGYTVEFFVEWDLLDDAGFTGLTEWKTGGQLYLDFQIVDAMGPTEGGSLNGQTDFGVFILDVDGSMRYDELNDYTEPSILGFIPYDKFNYYEFDANEGHTITLADAFEDVKQGEYYVKPIYWAMSKGITNGTSATTFEPNSYCTRGQIVTFIWRSKGCPEPTTTTNNFVDVKAGEYYVKAVLWAVENGITDGVDATHFDPNGICTRAQAVTFMYRAAGKPVVTAENKFVDIPAGEWFTNAVIWASSHGITNGTDATHFSPNDYCTRGQIVTFLYRNAAFGIESGAVI